MLHVRPPGWEQTTKNQHCLPLAVETHRCTSLCCLSRAPGPGDGIKPTAAGPELLPSNYLLWGFTSKNQMGGTHVDFPKRSWSSSYVRLHACALNRIHVLLQLL